MWSYVCFRIECGCGGVNYWLVVKFDVVFYEDGGVCRVNFGKVLKGWWVFVWYCLRGYDKVGGCYFVVG